MVSFNSLLLFIASAAVAVSALPSGVTVSEGTSARSGPGTTATTCAPLWAQCDSPTWAGPACCEGATCQVLNPFWSQCLLPV
ncbi:hypothetical protein B0H10DRAFT_2009259 [Mycena sp. CBHHK59/15]|nr:hypothetical protein B0H10DRAFT_2009259 [Mycena sp. CBHHK59/15]